MSFEISTPMNFALHLIARKNINNPALASKAFSLIIFHVVTVWVWEPSNNSQNQLLTW